MSVEPQNWLQQMVGDWAYEFEPQPHDENCHFGGTETARALGGIWVQAEGKSQMPDGSPALTQMTLGYDPEKGRFVGTWLGSMMTYLWRYDGELDAEGRVLTLQAEGPAFCGESGKMANYRDIIAFESPDHRTLTSMVQGDDGNWTQFMKAHYRRVK